MLTLRGISSLLRLTFFGATISLGAAPSAQAAGDIIQFFGDVYLPHHVLKKTDTTIQNLALFRNVMPILKASDINVINFEGVATRTTMPSTYKSFLLKMPLNVAQILKKAGVTVATLSNNHAMDFGYMGLFDSLAGLEAAGIEVTGAGSNLAEALRPAIVASKYGTICIMAFNRTLPREFWATEQRPGTAYLDYDATESAVRRCSKSAAFTFVVFHWGGELKTRSKVYQRELARRAIAGGADAVIGHHPHILQEIEIYQNKPIFYSIGNFTFGTRPFETPQEGLSVQFHLARKGQIKRMTITPLIVRNADVKFVPRLLEANDIDPVKDKLPKNHRCDWHKKKRQWSCRL